MTGSKKSVAAGFLAAALVSACSSDSSEPVPDCQSSKFAVCPCGLQPTFDSIRTNVFEKSCALSECHAASNAVNAGDLDLETDPYTALLGSDGRGAPGNNISGSVKNPNPDTPVLRRVVPGDPDQSFLVIKLMTTVGSDPKYGSGMPYTAPGSVCPEALNAVRDWIKTGAQK